MITSIFLLIVSLFTDGLYLFFSSVSFAVPDDIESALVYLFSHLGILQPLFPVDTLLQNFQTLFTFMVFLYTIKFGLTIWSLIPWIGTSQSFGTGQFSNVSSDSSGRSSKSSSTSKFSRFNKSWRRKF